MTFQSIGAPAPDEQYSPLGNWAGELSGMAHDNRSKIWLGILIGGGIAATLDIVYAFIRNAFYGRSVEWVSQSVASGLLGERAFQSGVAGAVLGLVAHYLILFIAAGLYAFAARNIAALTSRPLENGALFGIGVYLFMNFVVLPLSAFPFNLSHPFARLAEGFVSHAILVGIPIAFATRWAMRRAR